MKTTVLIFIALFIFGSQSATFTLLNSALSLCASLGGGSCDLVTSASLLFGLTTPGASDDVVLLSGASPLFLTVGSAVTWNSINITGSASNALTNLNITAALTLNAASTIGSNAILNIQSGGSLIASSITVAAQGVLSTVSGTTVSVSSSLSVAAQGTLNLVGSLTVTSTTTVSGSASFGGQSQLNGGLSLQSGGSVIFTGGAASTVSGSFNAASSTTLTVDTATNVTTSVAATVSGTAVIKGNFIASGLANGYTQYGGVLKGVGAFFANVSITFFGNLSAGLSPGTIFVNGNLNLDSTSTTEIEADSASNYDKIVVSGTANINGFCWLKLVGYQPSSSTTFNNILTYSKYTGSFVGVNAEGFTNFFTSKTTASYGSLFTSLTFTPNASSMASVLLSLLVAVIVFI